MGHSLQDILNTPNAGKDIQNVSPVDTSPDNIKWRDQVIRIYFQNVNGLRVHDDGSDIVDAFLHMDNIHADIFGMAETQLHCRSTDVQKILHKCRRQVWDSCKVFTCSSEDPWTKTRNPGWYPTQHHQPPTWERPKTGRGQVGSMDPR